jgi:signal transduction histidine kinase
MTASKKHLLPRFAVSSLVAFVAVGFVVSAVISSQARDQTEAAARDHARFVTSSILAQALTPRDLRAPMDVEGDRYRTLRHLVQGRILHATFPVVRVKIWRADGTILFADDPELVGRRFEVEEDLQEALHGEVASDVTDLSAKENVDERGLASKLFETYVPLYLDSRRPQAVVEVYSDIAPVSSTIGHSFKLVGLALLAGLAGIYLLQLPIVRRLGKALGDQNRRLQDLLRTERETVARLEELNRLKGAFVDVASHELRTPLTTMVGYAKMLRRESWDDDNGSREQFLEAIERQGDRMHRLVENLLAASQIDGDALRPSVAEVSIEDVVRATVARLGPASGRIGLRIPDDLPPVATDERLLELILANLLDNAVKFSAPEDPIEVGVEVQGASLVCWVRDAGSGIDPSTVGRLFDRFYQADGSTTRRHGGVGLGLSIVKECVDRLGGEIDIESNLGTGTTVTVRLPAQSAEAEPTLATERS